MSKTILITGGSRGIGRALCDAYKADGWTVLATARDPNLAEMVADEAFALDVEKEGSIAALVEALSDRQIDIIWNNAGVYLDKGMTLDDLSSDVWLRSFHVNTVAPVKLAKALAPTLARSEIKRLAFTTSRMASISGLGSSNAYAYRSSKAALNMGVSLLTHELAPQGIETVLFHPGWVRTDMGGSAADLDVVESASGMKSVMDDFTSSQSGAFLNYDGSPIDW